MIMDLKRLIKSFADAWRGIVYVYQHEQNFKIQLFTAVIIIFFMAVLKVRKNEMIVIFLLILLVLILELINSAMEKFLDILKPRLHFHVALVKDIMAAMVLLASAGTVAIGGYILLPYIFSII
jgi:diacylglycerol kinase